MAIKWANSADKHGVPNQQALFAIVNAMFVAEEFDEPRMPGGARPTLYIGPSRLGGPLLEVMVEKTPPRDLFIFHAMKARPKILKLMEENNGN